MMSPSNGGITTISSTIGQGSSSNGRIVIQGMMEGVDGNEAIANWLNRLHNTSSSAVPSPTKSVTQWEGGVGAGGGAGTSPMGSSPPMLSMTPPPVSASSGMGMTRAGSNFGSTRDLNAAMTTVVEDDDEGEREGRLSRGADAEEHFELSGHGKSGSRKGDYLVYTSALYDSAGEGNPPPSSSGKMKK